MKKLKDLGKNDVIHCPDEKDVKPLMELFDKEGFRWLNRDSYIETPCWDKYKQNTCYRVKHRRYSSLQYYKEQGYTIHQAKDFLYPQIKGYIVKPKYKVAVGKLTSFYAFKLYNGVHFSAESKVVDKLKGLNVLDLFCEPVEQDIEIIHKMPGFELSIDKFGIYYGWQDVTLLAERLCMLNTKLHVCLEEVTVKEITFEILKFGQEETKLSQWKEVYQQYKTLTK